MFYTLLPNGSVPTGGSATTTAGVILAGTTSDCLATNQGQNTASILNIASQLNPSFVYTPPGSQSTGGANNQGNNAAAGSGTNIGRQSAFSFTPVSLFAFVANRWTLARSPARP